MACLPSGVSTARGTRLRGTRPTSSEDFVVLTLRFYYTNVGAIFSFLSQIIYMFFFSLGEEWGGKTPAVCLWALNRSVLSGEAGTGEGIRDSIERVGHVSVSIAPPLIDVFCARVSSAM